MNDIKASLHSNLHHSELFNTEVILFKEPNVLSQPHLATLISSAEKANRIRSRRISLPHQLVLLWWIKSKEEQRGKKIFCAQTIRRLSLKRTTWLGSCVRPIVETANVWECKLHHRTNEIKCVGSRGRIPFVSFWWPRSMAGERKFAPAARKFIRTNVRVRALLFKFSAFVRPLPQRHHEFNRYGYIPSLQLLIARQHRF